MAQYKIDDPDELKECPYDKVHMIAAKRMQYHLMKCRKNHPGVEFAVCPYNARHEVRKPELRYHMTTCPDKARLEPAILHEQNKENNDGQYIKGCTDLPAYDRGHHESSENWDEEIPSVARVGVDPSYFLRLNARNTAGLSKKEKKQYLAQLNLPPGERYAVTQEADEELEEQKLRLPHAKPQTYMSTPTGAPTNLMASQPQQPSTLALSLSRSGVGRGQLGGRGMLGVGQQPIGRGQLGLGRAAGRGVTNAGVQGYGYSSNIPNTASIPNGALSNGHSATVPQSNGSVPVTNQVYMMGVGRGGRGIGRGSLNLQQNGSQPSFVVPNVNKLAKNAASSGSEAEDGNMSSGSNGASGGGDAKKEKRRLEKKLRQIELLEGKVAEGYKMTSEEEIKCEKKGEILEAIKNLQI